MPAGVKVSAREIRPGWVVYLPKEHPEFEIIPCHWANTRRCKKYCRFDDAGYGHPVAIVQTKPTPSNGTEILFIQVIIPFLPCNYSPDFRT